MPQWKHTGLEIIAIALCTWIIVFIRSDNTCLRIILWKISNKCFCNYFFNIGISSFFQLFIIFNHWKGKSENYALAPWFFASESIFQIEKWNQWFNIFKLRFFCVQLIRTTTLNDEKLKSCKSFSSTESESYKVSQNVILFLPTSFVHALSQRKVVLTYRRRKLQIASSSEVTPNSLPRT